jgi:hypothetical protein
MSDANAVKKNITNPNTNVKDLYKDYVGYEGSNFTQVKDLIVSMKDKNVDTIKVGVRRNIIEETTEELSLADLERYSNETEHDFLIEYLGTLQSTNTGDLCIDHSDLEVMSVESIVTQPESPTLDEWIERSRELSQNGFVDLYRKDIEHNYTTLHTCDLIKLKEEFLKSSETNEKDFIESSLGWSSDHCWEDSDVDRGEAVFYPKVEQKSYKYGTYFQ